MLEARNITLLGKASRTEDGRLMFLNNHLVSVWKPRSFIEHRGGGKELTVKGRIKRGRGGEELK